MTYEDLLAHNQHVQAENAALRERVAELEHTVATLEAARRAGKRQAAPSSRGQPKAQAGGPGSGVRLNRITCLTCGGELVDHTVQVQYQVEIPPVQPVVTRFSLEVARCRECGQRALALTAPGGRGGARVGEVVAQAETAPGHLSGRGRGGSDEHCSRTGHPTGSQRAQDIGRESEGTGCTGAGGGDQPVADVPRARAGLPGGGDGLAAQPAAAGSAVGSGGEAPDSIPLDQVVAASPPTLGKQIHRTFLHQPPGESVSPSQYTLRVPCKGA